MPVHNGHCTGRLDINDHAHVETMATELHVHVHVRAQVRDTTTSTIIVVVAVAVAVVGCTQGRLHSSHGSLGSLDPGRLKMTH